MNEFVDYLMEEKLKNTPSQRTGELQTSTLVTQYLLATSRGVYPPMFPPPFKAGVRGITGSSLISTSLLRRQWVLVYFRRDKIAFFARVIASSWEILKICITDSWQSRIFWKFSFIRSSVRLCWTHCWTLIMSRTFYLNYYWQYLVSLTSFSI